MLRGSVTGRAEVAKLKADIAAVPPTLHERSVTGVRRAMVPFRPDVVAETKTLPKRGGYAALMAAAVVVTTRVTATSRTISASARVSGKGKKEERDVTRVNKGQLRHPVFGRWRFKDDQWVKNPWAVTAVRPGFVTRPQDALVDRVQDELKGAVNQTADKLKRG